MAAPSHNGDADDQHERAQRCENCRFWERTPRDTIYPFEDQMLLDDEGEDRVMVGQCHRFPPAVDGVTLGRMGQERMAHTGFAGDDAINYHLAAASRWPHTWEDAWCGEWQPVPDQPSLSP